MYRVVSDLNARNLAVGARRRKGSLGTQASVDHSRHCNTGQLVSLNRRGGAQQQPQAIPFHAARPSFRRSGMAASAASESNQAIWNSALIARPVKAMTAR